MAPRLASQEELETPFTRPSHSITPPSPSPHSPRNARCEDDARHEVRIVRPDRCGVVWRAWRGMLLKRGQCPVMRVASHHRGPSPVGTVVRPDGSA